MTAMPGDLAAAPQPASIKCATCGLLLEDCCCAAGEERLDPHQLTVRHS